MGRHVPRFIVFVVINDGYLTYYLEATLTIQEGIESKEYSAFSSILNGEGRVVLTVHERVKKE